MTQKTDTLVETKSGTTAKINPVKLADNPAAENTVTKATEQPKKSGAVTDTGDLSPEVIELVSELRDTVKRLEPRKHTAKTLRRSLANVRDILIDIEALYAES